MLCCGPYYESADAARCRSDAWSEEIGHGDATANGEERRGKYVDTCLARYQTPDACRHERYDEDCQRAARSAQGVGGMADSGHGEYDKRRGMESIGYGDSHGRAGHSHGEGACLDNGRDASLAAYGGYDGADEE